MSPVVEELRGELYSNNIIFSLNNDGEESRAESHRIAESGTKGSSLVMANGSMVTIRSCLCPWQTLLINPYFPLNSDYKSLLKSAPQNPGATAWGRECFTISKIWVETQPLQLWDA